jgi:hypothetical protein
MVILFNATALKEQLLLILKPALTAILDAPSAEISSMSIVICVLMVLTKSTRANVQRPALICT